MKVLRTLFAPLVWLVRSEVRAYRTLWLWARRTTDTESRRHRPLATGGGTLALPSAFLVATLIEVAVLHLLIPWVWLSVTLAVLSFWSLLLVFAMVVTDLVRPHYLTDRELVLRRGGRVVARVPLDRIATITPRRRYNRTATVVDAGRLYLAGPDGTTVDLALHDPVAVRLTSLFPGSRFSGEVAQLSLSLDEPMPVAVAAQ